MIFISVRESFTSSHLLIIWSVSKQNTQNSADFNLYWLVLMVLVKNELIAFSHPKQPTELLIHSDGYYCVNFE